MSRRFAFRSSSSMKKIWSEFTTNVSKGTRDYSKAADSSLKLQLLKSFRVAPPTTPLLDQWMHLSHLDTVVPPLYVPAFLIYTKDTLQNVSFDGIISTLQTSLQRALVAFYPFSGRLKQDHKSMWQVHVNNQGAQFNIAETQLELQDIQYYMPGPEQDMLAPPSSVTDTCGQGVSPVLIQVTRFKCGALAVCCSVHHHLADAQGMSLFVKSWADLARNGSANAPAISHDRTPLLVTRQAPLRTTAAAPPPIFSRKEAPTSINPHQKTGAFLTDSSFIARAKQESSGLSATTTFEAITSFFWQQILKAQQDTGLGSGALATLCMMVNGRKQMGLPMGFVGNASVPVRATGPLKELLQQPLSFAAERIRMGVKEVDRQYIMSVIEHCSSHENACYIRDDVVATSAARLPIYDVDFGWGKPTFAGFQMPPPGVLEGGILYTQAPGADGAVAYVQLDHRVLESLMKNGRVEQMAFNYKQIFT